MIKYIPVEDRWVAVCVGLICATILAIVMFYYISKNQEMADAFKNGYEQVWDSEGRELLWKKSGKEP